MKRLCCALLLVVVVGILHTRANAEPPLPEPPAPAPAPVVPPVVPGPLRAVAPAVPAPCSMNLGGAARALVSHAQFQILDLQGACNIAQATALVSSTGAPVSATIAVTGAGSSWRVTLEFLQPLTATASAVWRIQQGGNDLAQFVAPAVEMTVPTTAAVRYDSQRLDQLQTKVSRTDGSLPVAVAGPHIHNIVALGLGAELPDHFPDRRWRVVGSTWADGAAFMAIDNCVRDGSAPNPIDCDLDAIDSISFVVPRDRSTPLRLTLRLPDAPPPGATMSAPDSPAVLQVTITLAARADTESMPLPIAGVTLLSCAANPSWDKVEAKTADIDTITGNAGIIAVSQHDYAEGHCRLRVDLSALVGPGGGSMSPDERDAYGPQHYTIRVHRVGASDDHDDTTTSFSFSVLGRDLAGSLEGGPRGATMGKWTSARLRSSVGPATFSDPEDPTPTRYISMPAFPSTADGSYVITVSVDKTYTFRPPPAQAASSVDDGTGFHASMVLRGPLSCNVCSFRVFATIPVNIVGVRFPAAARDLRNSTQSTVYQSTTLTAGLLVSLEPWDYRLAKARGIAGIPVRFQFGANFLNLSNAGFAPSLLLGLSATLPVIDSPSAVGSTLALGAFYEMDLREEHPWISGNHLLVTIGFNVLSLGPASSSPPH